MLSNLYIYSSLIESIYCYKYYQQNNKILSTLTYSLLVNFTLTLCLYEEGIELKLFFCEGSFDGLCVEIEITPCFFSLV